MDPSLRNWGLSSGVYDTDLDKLTISDLGLTSPVLTKGKQTRQNSIDLESAKQLAEGAIEYLKNAHVVFVEVPVGSQNSRAAVSYGICVGILGTLRANGIQFIEVTPAEVKLAGAGKEHATKREMIQWAMQKHPEARWPTYRKGNISAVTESKAEHMADAIGSIYAGLAGNPFKQMLFCMSSY